MNLPPAPTSAPPTDSAGLVRDIDGVGLDNVPDPDAGYPVVCDHVRRQEVIVHLGQKALAGMENAALLEECAALVAQTLAADACLVWEHQLSRQRLVVLASTNQQTALAGETIPDGTASLAGRVVRLREPLVVDDHPHAGVGMESPPLPVEIHCGRSSAGVLIGSRCGEEPFGVLQVHSQRRGAFSPEDVTFLQAVANVIAIAGDRAGREETLSLTEARYRRAAANTPGMVYQFRLSADGKFTFPFASEGCREMFGLEPQTIYDTPEVVIGILHESDRDTLFPAILASAQTMTQFHWLGRYYTAGGQIGWMRADSRPELQADGSVIWDGMMFDISALKEAQYALQLAKMDAERANRAKSEFLSRMSHELRTPLNAILGFGEFLQMHETRDMSKDCLGHIVKAGSHLLGLINEVLDIARIESGHIALHIEPVPVREVVEGTLDLIRGAAQERQIALHWTPPPEAGCRVLADAQRFRQVLLNLLSNAVKYNLEGGLINVVCRPWPGERICLEVADTGPGIPADKLGRLFVAFDRLGAESSGVQGTGLGLALSKCLVEAMEGGIEVESEPGLGTVFRLILPVAPDQAAPGGNHPAPGTVGDGEGSALCFTQPHRVLYIEDDDANFLLAKRLLNTHPSIALERAATAGEGLEILERDMPDLVLLDLHLPDRHGAEVLAHLRNTLGLWEVPVIVMSADATQRSIERLLEAGASDYITKPLDLHHLLKVMHALLER